MGSDESIQSKGGRARAEKLPAEKRREIATAAAAARWSVPEATHTGDLELIGGLKIPCAVLEDGRRVLSEHGITTALGSRSGASKRAKRDGWAPLPIFLAPKRLEPFISEELRAGLLDPIRYRSGDRIVTGYLADLLPEICNVWLSARAAGRLQRQQMRRAQQAEMLTRGLATVGIVALVDEATGYQHVRARDALEKVLERYMSDHLLRWAKRFPDDFYKQMFRLKGWDYLDPVRGRPGVVGSYTNDIVYQRLAPGVLEELQRRNPPNDRGQRKHKHHQWLSEDVGHPALRDHLIGVIALMKGTPDREWSQFKRTLSRVYPKCNEQIELALEAGE